MALKCVFTFVEGRGGWSETYYATGTDPSSYLVINNVGVIDPTCPAFVMMLARTRILNTACYVQHCRVSVVGIPFTTLGAFFDGTIRNGAFPSVGQAANAEPTEVFSKLLIRLLSGNTRRKSLWLGGIPEEIIAPGTGFNPTGVWNRNFRPYRDLLLSGIYQLVGRQTAATGPVAVPITAWAPTATGQGAVVSPIVAPAGPPPFWYVIVRSLKYPHGWNGVHRAAPNPANNTSMIIGPARRPGVTLPAWDVGGGGTVQALVPPTNPVTNVIQDYITHRKVGRPFDDSVGRRPRP